MADFTAIGNSAAFYLAPGRNLLLTISGTFVAVMELQRRISANAWETVCPITVTKSLVLPPGTYRLACTGFTSGTATYVQTTTAQVLWELRDGNGVLRARIDGDGNVTGFGGVTGTILRGTGEDGLTAHAGGTKAAALALSALVQDHRISVCATDDDSVLLPPAVVGERHFVMNSGASKLRVFGAGTDTINDVVTATGVQQNSGVGALYVCIAAGAWYRALGS